MSNIIQQRLKEIKAAGPATETVTGSSGQEYTVKSPTRAIFISLGNMFNVGFEAGEKPSPEQVAARVEKQTEKMTSEEGSRFMQVIIEGSLVTPKLTREEIKILVDDLPEDDAMVIFGKAMTLLQPGGGVDLQPFSEKQDGSGDRPDGEKIRKAAK